MKKILLGTAIALCLLSTPILAACAQSQVFREGDRSKAQIAITMDDCYNMDIISQVLDIAEEYGVHVTFYPIGINIKPEDGELWRRVVEGGHEIGNHTWSHAQIEQKVSSQYIFRQFVRLEEALDAALGYHYTVRTFRPPYGRDGLAAYRRLYEKHGYPYIVKWSISNIDFDACRKKLQNGSILLFHANQKDLDCIRQLIPAALEMGLTPVTVSELLELAPVIRERDEGKTEGPVHTVSP